MTNTLELEIAIRRAGKTRLDVANELKISLMGFFNKLHNKTEFKLSEIVILCRFLKLTELQRNMIFFTESVDCTST